MGINWGKFATESTINIQGIYEAAAALHHLGDSGVEMSENIREATVTSTKTLANCAEFIAVYGDRTVTRNTGQITGSLRDASEKMHRAIQLACKSANSSTRQFGNDNYRVCTTLVKGMQHLGDQLERSSLVISNDAKQSVKHLSVALGQFGDNIESVGHAHRDASMYLQQAITDGCRELRISLVEGSDNIRQGLQGVGVQAAAILAVATILVVLYMYPPFRVAGVVYSLLVDFGSLKLITVLLCISVYFTLEIRRVRGKCLAQEALIKDLNTKVEMHDSAVMELRSVLKEQRLRLELVEKVKVDVAQVSDIVDRELLAFRPSMTSMQVVY